MGLVVKLGRVLIRSFGHHVHKNSVRRTRSFRPILMRLLDNIHGKPTQNAALYLTSSEVETLKERLGWLLAHPSEHFHLEDNAGREISASIYEDAALRDPARKARYNQLEREMFDEG